MNNQTLPLTLTVEYSPDGDPQNSQDIEVAYDATIQDFVDQIHEKFPEDNDGMNFAMAKIAWDHINNHAGSMASNNWIKELSTWLQSQPLSITDGRATRI